MITVKTTLSGWKEAKKAYPIPIHFVFNFYVFYTNRLFRNLCGHERQNQRLP
jgi:hypothetical protein